MDSKKQAQGIASLGRYGDTTLMHMRPDEVEQLTAISRANGGDITINPKTGMPEAFLGDFLGALAPTAAGLAAGAIFPGAPFLAPALAGGATAYLQGKRDPLSLGMGALGGYGGGQLGASLRGFGGTQAVQPELAGTAEIGGGTAGTSTFVPTDTTIGGANLGAPPTAVANSTAVGQPMPAYMQTQGGFRPTSTIGGPDFTPQQVDVPYRDQFNVGPQQMLDTSGQPIPPLQGPVKQAAFEQGLDLGKGLAETGRGLEAATKDPMEYLKFRGDGDAFKGGIKTALPFAGAGAEAYMKGYYEDLPTYEASTAGKYDPTRTLNLGMDTGLRLLAKGGKVNYEQGGVVRDRSYYGIEPQYNTTGASYTPIMGLQGGRQTRVPVQGFVDVGGKFVADPKGTMTDVDYENRFKYVTEGVAKPEDSSGGDFESKAGLQSGAGGINPGVALQAAQGYAESQQSNLDEQGLGTLKTGGSVRRFQMGGTTAEQNKQNIQSMYGDQGQTTAEQNLTRDPLQEAGTVVTQSVPNTTAESNNIVTLGDTKYDLSKAQGDVKQTDTGLTFGNPLDMFRTVIPNPLGRVGDNPDERSPIRFGNMIEAAGYYAQNNLGLNGALPTSSNNTALNLNTGEQEQMAMGGKVKYANGGIAELTPDDGKMLSGNGDGVSDDIPAMIEGEQEAALSDGEFIVPARIVSELGNGSSDAGAQKLYAMIDRIQAARKQTMGDNKQYAKDTNAERYLPA